MKKFLFLISILLISPVFLLAQHDLTLYQMDRVPQRLSVNPAFIPETNYLGFPFLSEVKFLYRQPFSYNQVLEKDVNDTLNLKAENFLNVLAKHDRIHNENNFTLLDLGTTIAGGNYFIHFALKERISEDIRLPESFFSLAWYGNGAPQYLGKTTEFSPRFSGSCYDEWSAGVAGRFMKNRLTAGINLKYLSGRFNVKTNKADFTFFTSPEFYDIYVSSDMDVQTSGVSDIEEYFNQPVGSLVFSGNHGFAVDFGATFKVNEKIDVSASVADLGFINWKSQTTHYISKEPGKQFIYTGMTIGDFMEAFSDFSTFGEKVIDSIVDLTEVDSIPGGSYNAGIPVKYNLCGSYRINDRSRATLLLNGISTNSHFYPALSAGYTFDWTKAVALNVTYNLFNHQYYNIGLGFTLNAGPVQIYMVTDNLPGMVFYKSTNNYSFQFGFNFLLGRNKNHVVNNPEPSTNQ